ncbi:hypothetical protein MCI89_04020 [Muricomes sp. OA1]|uniref:Uncharacterized protein n=1 Tax=Faecalicatena contorta TaxID=39482 RepID=A0A174HD49_9FIRM|nr:MULTISPECIES: hypothetical protein [Clostridia]MEE0201569.1 hypothetical protein [Muricomes sp.]MCH1971513.1 hypothetical protein [Muricomes sp. OA1]MSC83932.1 hypothetical protein [Eubacterium sp. BIOML-A1]MSD06298.1 hypothetical protein [Eubacterium sp. BIOML-A2]CUO71307.1 Uncharacterised protein [[Eubacterium] contortum] [Faecalicatena contorta]
MQNTIFEMLRYIEQNSGNEFCEQLPQLTEEEAVRIYEEDFKQRIFLPKKA